MDADAINWNGEDYGWEASLVEKKAIVSLFNMLFDITTRYQSGNFKWTAGYENLEIQI